MTAMFSDVWVDLIRQAHAEVPETEAVLFTRADGTVVHVSYLVIDLPAPDFQARRLVVAGTTLDGKPSRDVFIHDADAFPPELVQVIAELTQVQRECPLEM